MAESLLDKEFLARLEYLYVLTRELFIGHASADRISKKFGVGMEFADHRSYAPGDDFRYIDWAAYARREDLLIKLFSEERAAQLYFVVDTSRSMATGTPQKLLYAKKIAAALGYIGLTSLDPVTLITFDDTLRGVTRRFQGRGQLRHMISFLENVQPSGQGTGMGEAFRQFVRRFTTHGTVVVISDFLDREGYEETLRLLHYHRFDLLAVQVNSREEIDPDFVGDLELVDSESGERTLVQMTPELRKTYLREFDAHYSELRRLCNVLRRGYIPVVTDTPFEDLVFDVFRRGGLVR